jgi:hypothetical protein
MESTESTTTADSTTKPGTSFSVCEVSTVDGKRKFTHCGIAFIRATGNGGVLYFRPEPDGPEKEFALFRRLGQPKK